MSANDTPRESTKGKLTGFKVLLIAVGAFGVILTANLTLAFSAIETFPGLETKNSYVASQEFDRNRAAQEALGWDVRATVRNDQLIHTIRDRYGNAVRPDLKETTLGRATHVREDQTPDWRWEGGAFVAPVHLNPGNWNLRMVAHAADGTLFQQRIVIHVNG